MKVAGAFLRARHVELWQATIALAIAPSSWIHGSLWRREYTWVLPASSATMVTALILGGILWWLWKEDIQNASRSYMTVFMASALGVSIGSWAFIAHGPLGAVPATLVVAMALITLVSAWVCLGPVLAQTKA